MEKSMELANSIASMSLDIRVNAAINDKSQNGMFTRVLHLDRANHF